MLKLMCMHDAFAVKFALRHTCDMHAVQNAQPSSNACMGSRFQDLYRLKYSSMLQLDVYCRYKDQEKRKMYGLILNNCVYHIPSISGALAPTRLQNCLGNYDS